MGANVASLIDDGSCISFSVGPLFDVLATNKAMLKVFESASEGPIRAVFDGGVYELTIPFDKQEGL